MRKINHTIREESERGYFIMQKNINLIMEYESILLGKKGSVSSYYFSYDAAGNERIALELMKYAFETYLRWSPIALRDHLDMEIIELLKLKSFMKYLNFPPELDPKKDLFYIAWKIYPNTVHISHKDLILRVYESLLDGSIQKFPKDYFLGIKGVQRAALCFNYMLEQYLQFKSVEEMYEFFSGSAGTKALKKYKLFAICKDMFESPLEFLHTALPPSQKNDFLFNFYTFQKQLNN